MNNLQYAKVDRILWRAIVTTMAIASVAFGALIVLVVYTIGCQVLGL